MNFSRFSFQSPFSQFLPPHKRRRNARNPVRIFKTLLQNDVPNAEFHRFAAVLCFVICCFQVLRCENRRTFDHRVRHRLFSRLSAAVSTSPRAYFYCIFIKSALIFVARSSLNSAASALKSSPAFAFCRTTSAVCCFPAKSYRDALPIFTDFAPVAFIRFSQLIRIIVCQDSGFDDLEPQTDFLTLINSHPFWLYRTELFFRPIFPRLCEHTPWRAEADV